LAFGVFILANIRMEVRFNLQNKLQFISFEA